MSETTPTNADREWYADGLRFQCSQCGNCCTGPPGYVWFTMDEAEGMATHLKMSLAAFLAKHARQVHGRWSLRETRTSHGFDCIFLDRESTPGKATCSLYGARPGQCRTWPFWPENLFTRQAWEDTKRDTPCPGMDSGPIIPIEQIRIQRDETHE